MLGSHVAPYLFWEFACGEARAEKAAERKLMKAGAAWGE